LFDHFRAELGEVLSTITHYQFIASLNSGEVTSIVAVIGLVLSTLGITGIDSTMLASVVNGVVSVVAIGAALWSWYKHRDPAPKVTFQQG
jgi:hypothetical protein